MYQMEGLTTAEAAAIYAVLVIAVLGLLYAAFLRRQILKEDKGTAKMQEVWNAIRVGADSYLRLQLRSVLPWMAILTVAMFFSVYIIPPSAEALHRFASLNPGQVSTVLGVTRALAFVMGASFSLLVGQRGCGWRCRNVRVTAASVARWDSLRIAYRTGRCRHVVRRHSVVDRSFHLHGRRALLLGFGGAGSCSMASGGSSQSGGRRADLVGKVEAGIEDDRATQRCINLVATTSATALGWPPTLPIVRVTIVSGSPGPPLVLLATWWIIFPLLVRGIGVVSSMIGTYLVRGGPGKAGDAMRAIFTGFLSSAAISVVLFGLVAYFYLQDIPGGWWRPFLAVTVGVLLAIVIDRVTEYFTSSHGAPVRSIKKAADTGPATLILAGTSVGFESSVWGALVIGAAIFASILIFGGVDPAHSTQYVLYGVAMTGIGAHDSDGNNVAMALRPDLGQRQRIGEMAWHGMDDPDTQAARQIMADLDAVGNTTKAITKGVAIGSAVIAAVSLFGSFLVDVSRAQVLLGLAASKLMTVTGIRIDLPQVFVGMLIGASIPWLFSSFSIQAVARRPDRRRGPPSISPGRPGGQDRP
jgi:K(+)-stimulated pyrophosphate-energized sodium pump